MKTTRVSLVSTVTAAIPGAVTTVVLLQRGFAAEVSSLVRIDAVVLPLF